MFDLVEILYWEIRCYLLLGVERLILSVSLSVCLTDWLNVYKPTSWSFKFSLFCLSNLSIESLKLFFLNIQLGSTAIGIQTSEGVVLAVEKRITSPLMEPTSVEKIVEIDSHIGN